MLTSVERTMQEHSENIIKEISSIKMCQKETIELKNMVTALKNSKEGFSKRLDQMEERISKNKHKAVEVIKSEKKADKRKKNNDDS